MEMRYRVLCSLLQVVETSDNIINFAFLRLDLGQDIPGFMLVFFDGIDGLFS